MLKAIGDLRDHMDAQFEAARAERRDQMHFVQTQLARLEDAQRSMGSTIGVNSIKVATHEVKIGAIEAQAFARRSSDVEDTPVLTRGDVKRIAAGFGALGMLLGLLYQFGDVLLRLLRTSHGK